jgi:hypothetical protein
MPSHQKVLWGGRLVSFHDSFWVRNRSTPPRRMIWGSWAQ